MFLSELAKNIRFLLDFRSFGIDPRQLIKGMVDLMIAANANGREQNLTIRRKAKASSYRRHEMRLFVDRDAMHQIISM
jgi:hypothetical protein